MATNTKGSGGYIDPTDPHAIESARRYTEMLEKHREAAATPEGIAKADRCCLWVDYCSTLGRGGTPTIEGFKKWKGAKA